MEKDAKQSGNQINQTNSLKTHGPNMTPRQSLLKPSYIHIYIQKKYCIRVEDRRVQTLIVLQYLLFIYYEILAKSVKTVSLYGHAALRQFDFCFLYYRFQEASGHILLKQPVLTSSAEKSQWL